MRSLLIVRNFVAYFVPYRFSVFVFALVFPAYFLLPLVPVVAFWLGLTIVLTYWLYLVFAFFFAFYASKKVSKLSLQLRDFLNGFLIKQSD